MLPFSVNLRKLQKIFEIIFDEKEETDGSLFIYAPDLSPAGSLDPYFVSLDQLLKIMRVINSSDSEFSLVVGSGRLSIGSQ